ncbi:MAG: energy-coupling factor ABC transporter ATP-binding protein [Clostridia bacterium]|nr:energy-coupling factor ABC transporter ATP-binding protein [Clostridia bacterium]
MVDINRGTIMKAVEIAGLSFKYKEQPEYILDDISLSLNTGEIIALVGMSGSGKSTLCRCICGIIPHVQNGHLKGNIKAFGMDIFNAAMPEIASNVGIVFQNPDTQLFSPTVEDELAFGPENLCVDREEIGRRIDSTLELVGMRKYRYANPNQLSGGQKQLIAIASVLTMNPKLLICDEVMSQIDKEGKTMIKGVLMSLKDQGKTVLMIDHDFNNLDIADEIYVLKNQKIQKYLGDI